MRTFQKNPILLTVTCSIWTLLVFGTRVSAEDTKSATPEAVSAAPKTELEKAQATWRKTITRIPTPKKGCFQASYPNTVWNEVTCVAPPQNPYLPGRASLPFTIGATQDVSAQVTGQITSATGSFDSVSPSISETGTTFGPNCSALNSSAPNAFSLQLNTAYFTTPLCQGRGAQCQGLEQFVYSNAGYAFIQYWLANATSCPSGWNSAGSYCYMTGPDSTLVTSTPQSLSVANLVNVSLTGDVSPTGDKATVTVNGQAFATNTSLGNVLGLSGNWNNAEFGIFGDACGSEAFFSPGSQIVTRTTITDNSQKAPTCVALGYTGEKNNLSFGPTAPAPSGNPPALLVTESTAGGAPSWCAAATSVGDTHLATFDGLAYDFQATGDFLLVQADGGFLVETRQISGAPTWPNAATNTAVATKMGGTRVALCANPTRLMADSESHELDDGKSFSLPGGVDVSRNNNVYTIHDDSGNSVRATLNDNSSNSWIDVAVGLGHTPQVKVSGLLVNARGNVHAIATKNGAVFVEPVSFDELYHTYANSWRVAPAESLLSVCGKEKIEPGLPNKPFFARDLSPKVYENALAVCKAAGITAKSLLDACTLDVAVTGNKNATKVFRGMVAPIYVLPPPVLGRSTLSHDK